MKKIYLFLSAAVLSLMGFFTACEDVPAPYGIEDEELDVPGQEDILLKESFAASFGRFQNYTTSGEGEWKIDYGTAKASGFDFDNKVNTAGVYYLVSPEVSLAGQTEVHLSYEYILAYKSRVPNGNKLFITDSFDETKADQNWTEIPVNHLEADRKDDGKIDWKAFKTIDVQIPEEFLGKNIRFAFYHECTSTGSTTMEIKNVKLAVGKAADGEDKPEVEEGVRELPYGESFATDFGGFKNITTSGSGEWKIDYNTAKATGYDFNNKVNTPGTYYLVSPEISLAGQTEVHLTYEYIQAYANKLPDGNKLFITADFDESKADQNWTELPVKHEEPNKTGEGKIDWKKFHKMDVQVPEAFLGKTIRIAFYHNCTDKASTTMEIKNFKIEVGKAEGGNIPDVKPEEGVQQLPYGESFSTAFGLFKNFTAEGAGEWKIDFKTAKASGWTGKDNIAGTYYLVSPEIALAGQTDAHVSFDYILAYGKNFANGDKLFITDNFNETAPAEGWTELPITLKEPNMNSEGKIDWKSFHKMDVQVPAEYMGKTVRVAFYHKCDENGSTTWEVKNFSIEAGKIGEGGNEGGNEGGGDTPDTGDVTATNGDFETWVDGLPNNWQSTTSASSENCLAQSDKAHSGSFSVLVKGGAGAGKAYNKRLAYKELTLKPGSYKVKFYTKAATSEGGTARAGYAIVTNGSISGGNDYKYGDYINDLSTDSWTEVNYEFTLDAETTVNMLVMNGKNPGKDILVDDYTLTDADGNFIIK